MKSELEAMHSLSFSNFDSEQNDRVKMSYQVFSAGGQWLGLFTLAEIRDAYEAQVLSGRDLVSGKRKIEDLIRDTESKP